MEIIWQAVFTTIELNQEFCTDPQNDLPQINRIHQKSSVRPPSRPPDFWEGEVIFMASLFYYVRVYIIYLEKIDRYYTGVTEDVQWRLERHNQGWGRFTKRDTP